MRDLAHAPVRHYATIDSTNAEAFRLYEAGESGPLWLLADEQTAGRGRLDRTWVSEKGNCFSTLLLRLEHEAASMPQIGFAAALAVAEVAESHVKEVSLKWPNDVLVGVAKLSGILCEVVGKGVLAIGCGINVAHAPADQNYPTACLRGVSRDDVFQSYRERLAHWLRLWAESFDPIRTAWLSRAIGRGEYVSMTTGKQTHSGIFESIDDRGAIMLRQHDGGILTLHTGDLIIPSLQTRRRQTA